jgi:ubiquinone/menaquinone biosynthesis C-methylase UbiE
MSNRFNSDTSALIQRENINKSARYDLEEWIFQQVNLTSNNMRVLDLGCGTGKQIFALRNVLSSGSSILGVDISPDAVRLVNTRAKNEHLQNIEARECNLDEVVNALNGLYFDLILSSYAIYYSKNMLQLFSALPTLLNPDGQVFICGYGKGTNHELYEIIQKFTDKIKPIDDFIQERDIINIADHHYSKYRIVRLSNQVFFSTLEDILTWWKNHNSYLPEISQDVSDALQTKISREGTFSLTKNVLGVYYDVKRF